jgi:GAF domain-containing protein
VLTLADAAEALRASFNSRDQLRCAEIQIRLGGVLETALAISGTRMGHITRASDASRLNILVYRGLGSHFIERFDPIPVATGTAAGQAFLERKRVVVPDVMQEPDYASRRPDALLCGFRAVHATPIPAARRGAVQGVLTALFVQPHHVSPHEARDMDALAEDAGRLVANVGA